jgi:drug/metabolite transporter (DMT)-like permease
MRPMTIIGALLIAAGLYVLINGASFTRDKTVLKAGPLEANIKQEQSIPPWAGAVAIAAGVGFIVVGLRKS